MYKFDLRAFLGEPNASAVSLKFIAPNNIRKVPRDWPVLAETKRAQSLPLRHFYKGLREQTNLGKMGRKQPCTNLI